MLGIPIESDWRVVELQPGRRLRVDGTGPAGARASVTHVVVGDGASGRSLRMTVDHDLPAGALGEAVHHLLVERRSRRDAEAIVANIAELAESRFAGSA